MLAAPGARISVVKLIYPSHLVAGRLDGRVDVWDLREDASRTLAGHDGAIFSLDADAVRS